MNKIKKKFITLLAGILLLGTLAFQSDFFEVAKQIEIYGAVLKQLDMYYIDEINPGELNRKAMKKMLSSLDPYTVFYDEQGIEDVRIRRSGEYGGIGSHTMTRNKHLYITEPYENSPAARAGLKAGDEIIKIDDVSVKDYEGESVGSLLRGTPGTHVQLEVLRQGKVLHIDVQRAKIEMHPVPFYDMYDEHTGYIALIKFNDKTKTELLKAYRALKEKGMEKLILDLRGNPGGLLSQAIAVTNMFIPKDLVVVKTRAKVKKWSKTYKTSRDPIDIEIPLVVLVNGRSASASEIVSGSLQDYDRAVIMGERSFGKGLVQRYRNLPYGTQMKLTISKYYIPSGRCIQELDYTHRDENGDVPKFSDRKVKTFRTANGRKVIEGGGITPDIALKETQTLKITRQLFSSDAFFHFVTDYYYKHPDSIRAEDFVLDPAVYDQLMNYLREHPDEYLTDVEKKVEKEIKKADEKEYGTGYQTAYQSFLQKLVEEKISSLEQDKSYIIDRLTEDIVKRYLYRKGAYRQKLYHDTWVKEAAAILGNTKKYKKILR